MLTMKSVADLKRAIQPGVRLNLIFSKLPWDSVAQPMIEALEFIREVKQVNTVGFAVQSHKGTHLSYLDWPKAKKFQPDSDTRFTILDESGNPHLTYEILAPKTCSTPAS